MKRIAWIIPGCLIFLTTAQAVESCLRYEPTKVILSGKLVRLTFPGRPNFESIENGDEPETGFYLQLPQAICTNGDENSTDPSLKDVKLVQLVLNSQGYSKLKTSIGTSVTLSGSLFAGFTGHHHAPLLLQDITKK